MSSRGPPGSCCTIRFQNIPLGKGGFPIPILSPLVVRAGLGVCPEVPNQKFRSKLSSEVGARKEGSCSPGSMVAKVVSSFGITVGQGESLSSSGWFCPGLPQPEPKHLLASPPLGTISLHSLTGAAGLLGDIAQYPPAILSPSASKAALKSQAL